MENEDELNTKLVEKEKELNLAEESLDVVEGALLGHERRITELRIKRDELGIEVKKEEQEIEKLEPDYKRAKHNLQRMRREHEALKRSYFRSRRI